MRRGRSGWARPRILFTTLVVLALVASSPTAATAAPPNVVGATNSPVDQLAVTAAGAVQDFWRRTFPTTFGRQWNDISGGFYSVDTRNPAAPLPPCVDRLDELAGQALYCPSADVVAWDSGRLLPELRQRFGDAAVVVVIAHEIGHAVHYRLGLTAALEREPQRWPTILVEAAADCFAGAAIRDIRDGNTPGLPIDRGQLDDAMRALISFRDPVGTAATETDAHGNAFDRASAFQDGYRKGGRACAEMTIDNRTFTARRIGSAADAARDGNLPTAELLASVGADARAWFTELVAGGGRSWQAPALSTDPAAPPCPAGGDQGPVQYCPSDGRITVHVAALTTVHDSIGDYAGGVLVASRYALAAAAALRQPVQGPVAGRRALCLAGAYTGDLLMRSGRGYQLSPGDLDEAVHALLALDYAQRDAGGAVGGDEAGFERVEIFRAGTLGGPPACG